MKSFRLIALSFILSAVCTMAYGQELDGEYVDLGLSVKWCTHNHFSTAKSIYGSYYNMSRAMNAQTSTGARIPSKAEWQELIDNCVWKWTVQDGLAGYLLTSKVKGYKGNSIFIPAAGYWRDGGPEDLSIMGRYWSLTPCPQSDDLKAYSFFFQQGNVRWVADKKSNGNSVRLVIPLSGKEVAGISFEKSKYTMKQHTLARLNVTVSKDSRNVNSACKWTSADESVVRVMDDGLIVAVGAGSCTVRADAFGKSAECTITVQNSDVEFVDMGLDVLWAAANIGADKPNGYGNYYAWAEIEPKEMYLRSTYRYASYVNPYKDNVFTYNPELNNYPKPSIDGLSNANITLDPVDDVASVLSGGEWRMPTIQDFKELVDNSKQDTVAVDGVNGVLFTSLVPGYEDNSIFIPFSGMMERDEPVGRGQSTLMWTSSASVMSDQNRTASEYAICIGDGQVNELRYNGIAVRPVKEALK